MRSLLSALAVSLATVCLPTSALAQPASSEREDVETVATSDPEMNAAIATAKKTLPEFLAVLAEPPHGAGNISFKFPLGGWEHIWVYDVQREGDYLTGLLSNVPMQEAWSQDDPVRVPLKDVSDWAWMGSDGVMRGHYTTRVLLDRIDPQRARIIAQSMGWQ